MFQASLGLARQRQSVEGQSCGHGEGYNFYICQVEIINSGTGCFGYEAYLKTIQCLVDKMLITNTFQRKPRFLQPEN